MKPAGQSIAQKVQLRFCKRGASRYLSHHDVMRLFSRACRRAGLPVRLTQGFDPRPRLVFATALELGVESEAEAVDIELSRWVPPEQVGARLDEQLPDGIKVLAVRLLPPRRGGERVVETVYRVAPPGGAEAAGVTAEALNRVMSASELPFERPREKRIQQLDLRPSLADLRLEGENVIITLRPTQRGAARPAEIMSLLTGHPLMETRKWRTSKTSMRTAP